MASPTHGRRAGKLKSQLVSANAKLKLHVTPRRLLLLSAASASAFLLLLILRTLSAAAASRVTATPPVFIRRPQNQHPSRDDQEQYCDRLPAAVADTLVHYATTGKSNATRRWTTAEEVAAAARVVSRRAPCNLLVFGGLAGGGGGQHARLWAALNHAGRTVFLDDDDAAVSSSSSAIEAYRVAYLASAADTDELLALRDAADCAASTQLTPGHFDRSPCKLAVRGLPAAFYEAEWDVIVVDVAAPATDEAAGVMGAIYTAAVAARAGGGETTEVVVNDVDVPVMDRFSTAFLCGGFLKEEVGKLRRYAIPSHNKEGMPFCP